MDRVKVKYLASLPSIYANNCHSAERSEAKNPTRQEGI